MLVRLIANRLKCEALSCNMTDASLSAGQVLKFGYHLLTSPRKPREA